MLRRLTWGAVAILACSAGLPRGARAQGEDSEQPMDLSFSLPADIDRDMDDGSDDPPPAEAPAPAARSAPAANAGGKAAPAAPAGPAGPAASAAPAERKSVDEDDEPPPKTRAEALARVMLDCKKERGLFCSKVREDEEKSAQCLLKNKDGVLDECSAALDASAALLKAPPPKKP